MVLAPHTPCLRKESVLQLGVGPPHWRQLVDEGRTILPGFTAKFSSRPYLISTFTSTSSLFAPAT